MDFPTFNYNNPDMDTLSQLQLYDKYSRYLPDERRRETWTETVQRTVDFLKETAGTKLPEYLYDEIKQAIEARKVMPAMRLLATAGPTARRNNFAAYNCSFMGMDSIENFREALIILMNGAGVGYSVEQHYINKLPVVVDNDVKIDLRYALQHYPGVPEEVLYEEALAQRPTPTRFVHVVQDTTEGWGVALQYGIEMWMIGKDIAFDYSQVRPAGAPLKTKGGTASGPEPLKQLLDFTRKIILGAGGRKLTSLEVSDIMNMIGRVVVSGGHRRSSQIALYTAGDTLMEHAKDPGFEETNPQRFSANFSAVWPVEGVSRETFDAQWATMIAGQRGEPGIFNLQSLEAALPEGRARVYSDGTPVHFGTNPCGEIVLRHKQTCNLSSVVIRETDTEETLTEKVRIAAVLGTIQSMLDYFPGVDETWTRNQQEERLLGVDLNGIMSNALTRDPEVLSRLRDVAIATNREIAEQLGINESASVTTVKPSGNSSVFLFTSPGVHPWYAPYYMRHVRLGRESVIYKVLKAAGYPMVPDEGAGFYDPETALMFVAGFPVKAPEGAITRHDLTAIEAAQIAITVRKAWAQHNVSVTVNYREDEAEALGNFIYEHREDVNGMSFLPISDAQYFKMPYVELTAEEYAKAVAELPQVDWNLITQFDGDQDDTNASTTAACEGDRCLVELPWMKAARERGETIVPLVEEEIEAVA